MIPNTRPRITKWLVLATLIITAIFIMAGAFFVEQTPEMLKGPYTYAQEIVEGDGNVAEVYASGDQYYNYLHDENGFILERASDGNLYYAISDNGRPVASSVRYGSSQYLVNSIDKIGYDDVDFQAHPDLLNSYYTTATSEPLLSSATETARTVYNITIFIQFPEEQATVVNDALTASKTLYGNDDAETKSIRSFYKDMSGGQVVINNCWAYNDVTTQDVFVYTASNSMSYYQVLESGSTADRIAKERELLSGAMDAYDDQYKGSYVDADFDINDDGYFDSVCFVLLAKTSSSWGSLLWPHKWSATSSGIGMYNEITIGGETLKCGDYSLSFGYTVSGKYDLAVACHEMGHVFSAPDYYSYKSTASSYSFAGLLDLMGNTTDSTVSPSYMTAYTRKRYLKALKGSIADVNTAQSVTLTSATDATMTDTVAIKIPTTLDGVYLMAEYRRDTSSSPYDKSIGGRGVIIYRVNENASGNVDATSSSNYRNIELYVYRSGDSISNAFLDTVGDNFSNFRLNAINVWDITIKLTAISATTATIDISGPALSQVQPIPNDYFSDKVSVTSAETVIDETNYNFGVNATVSVTSDTDINKLSSMEVSLVDELGNPTYTMTANREALKTEIDRGNRSFNIEFNLLDKGSESWFSGQLLTDNTPTRVEVKVTDTDQDVIDIPNASKDIDHTGYLWNNVYSVARYYDAIFIRLDTPYVEIVKGGHFDLPIPALRSGRDDLTFSTTFTLPDGFESVRDSTTGAITVTADSELADGLYYVDYQLEGLLNTLTTRLTVNVVDSVHAESDYTTASVASNGQVTIGTPWSSLATTVTIGGTTVPLKNTTQLSYDPYLFTQQGSILKQTVKFVYGGTYYKTNIEIVDAIMAVNLDAPSFEVYPGVDSLPGSTKVNFYYWLRTKESVTLSTLSSSISYTLDSTPSTEYQPVSYTVTRHNSSITSSFNFFRVSVVDGSITPQGRTADGDEDCFVASLKSGGGVDYSSFKIAFSLVTGKGNTNQEAISGGETYYIEGLPTAVGYYPAQPLTIKYKKDAIVSTLGTINVNLRILNIVNNLAITSYTTQYTTGSGESADDPIVFYIDQYDGGDFVFKYVISFESGAPETVTFDLRDKAGSNYGEGAFSFSSNEWGISKSFYFFGVDVVKSIDVPTTAYYGEALPTAYIGTSHLGKTQTYNVTHLGYNHKEKLNPTQTVTFSISYDQPSARTIEFTKAVTTIDGVYSLVSAELVSTAFNYEEQMTVANLEFLTYLSYYDYYDGIDSETMIGDKENVSYSTLDHAVLLGNVRQANATLTLTYAGKTLDVAVTLVNGIASRRVKDSGFIKNTLYKQAGSLGFTYELTYQNGSVEDVAITFGEYTKVDGNSFICDGGLMGLQKLTVYNPLLPTEELTQGAPLNLFVYVYASNVTGLRTPQGQELSTITIKYGDILDLTDYIVEYQVSGVNAQLRLKRNYYTYTIVQGTQFAVVNVGILSTRLSPYTSAQESIQIIVLPRIDSEVLAVKEGVSGLKIDHDRGIVTMDNAMTKQELMDALTTDARFSLKYPSAWQSPYVGGYEVVDNRKNLYTVSVVNRDNTVVESYQVILRGDGNGDGVSDLKDLESFAKALLNGGDEYVNSFADSGTFTLEDFVKQIIDRKNQSQPSPIPLAELFVCEYRLKEDAKC